MRSRILALTLALSLLAVIEIDLLTRPRLAVTEVCPICVLADADRPALIDACTGETCPLHLDTLSDGVFRLLGFAGGGYLDREGDTVKVYFGTEEDSGTAAGFCKAHAPPVHTRYLLAGPDRIYILHPRLGECRFKIVP